jgi:hypothetical protein
MRKFDIRILDPERRREDLLIVKKNIGQLSWLLHFARTGNMTIN